nr:hypothetical protein CFP56_33157 [Quercus suber]
MATSQSPHSSVLLRPSKTEFLTCRSSTRHNPGISLYWKLCAISPLYKDWRFTIVPSYREDAKRKPVRIGTRSHMSLTLIFDESSVEYGGIA